MRAETDAAINAARLARRIADSRAGADAVQFKQGIDIVTAADVACEDAIREELARSFPDHPVVGEERGGEPRSGEPYWLVDPICGTRCYASDVPLYCTNIALVELTDADTGGAWTLDSRSFVIGATPQLHRELATLVRESR
jgi:fructose-1,6-bisphosphatase/inositol monophosphatase family enzyme